MLNFGQQGIDCGSLLVGFCTNVVDLGNIQDAIGFKRDKESKEFIQREQDVGGTPLEDILR